MLGSKPVNLFDLEGSGEKVGEDAEGQFLLAVKVDGMGEGLFEGVEGVTCFGSEYFSAVHSLLFLL